MEKSFEKPPIKNQERELSLQEQETLDFIESHKQSVVEAFAQLIKDNRFVLVGELHLDVSEPVRYEIATSLAKLQQEGLTHVALEANSVNQSVIDELDFSKPEIKKILKEKHVIPIGWGNGNLDLLIEAKRLGLKVVLIDYNDGRPDSQRNNAQWQNLRDSKMFDTINSQTDEKSRILIFVGNYHVHQKEVQKYFDGWVKPLGARLVEQYGKETVKSVRYVNDVGRFDNLLEFMSKTTSPKNISSGKEEVVIVPDQGPIKGDNRASAADYVVTVI